MENVKSHRIDWSIFSKSLENLKLQKISRKEGELEEETEHSSLLMKLEAGNNTKQNVVNEDENGDN